jgi:predicted transcriptional regulator
MAATTTIRLPPKLRAQVARLAKASGRSAHSFIVEAIERHAEYESRLSDLVKEARLADEAIERTGTVYRSEDVHAWLERLAVDGSAPSPKPWPR